MKLGHLKDDLGHDGHVMLRGLRRWLRVSLKSLNVRWIQACQAERRDPTIFATAMRQLLSVLYNLFASCCVPVLGTLHVGRVVTAVVMQGTAVCVVYGRLQ